MAPSHEEIRKTAYRLWEERGCPEGSPEVDWQRAEEECAEEKLTRAQDAAESSGTAAQSAQEVTKRAGRGAKP